MKMPFGAVPIGVAMPPILALYATPRSNGTASRPVESRSISAIATGSIINAVAVFEIHMLMSAVASMTAKTSRRPLVPPTALMVAWAIRRCAPQCSAALEIIKPPMKSKMIGSPYEAAARCSLRTPVSGNATSGTSAVAEAAALRIPTNRRKAL